MMKPAVTWASHVVFLTVWLSLQYSLNKVIMKLLNETHIRALYFALQDGLNGSTERCKQRMYRIFVSIQRDIISNTFWKNWLRFGYTVLFKHLQMYPVKWFRGIVSTLEYHISGLIFKQKCSLTADTDISVKSFYWLLMLLCWDYCASSICTSLQVVF